MQVKIAVLRGKAKHSQVALELPVIVGRSQEADLSIPHPAVSRQHCELFESEGRVRVRDLGSTNGTRVAGKKVTEAVLRSHDRFTIGPFTFVVDYRHVDDVTIVQPEEEEDDAMDGEAASVGERRPTPEESLADWGPSDNGLELWDEAASPADAAMPPPSDLTPGVGPRAEAGGGPSRGAASPVAKPSAKTPAKPAAKQTPSAAAPAATGPDAELGLDLDELLEGLEDLNLNDFLKGLQ